MSDDEYEDATEELTEAELPSELPNAERELLEKRLDIVEKALTQLQKQMKTITHNLGNISITLELHPSPVTKEQTKRVRS